MKNRICVCHCTVFFFLSLCQCSVKNREKKKPKVKERDTWKFFFFFFLINRHVEVKNLFLRVRYVRRRFLINSTLRLPRSLLPVRRHAKRGAQTLLIRLRLRLRFFFYLLLPLSLNSFFIIFVFNSY